MNETQEPAVEEEAGTDLAVRNDWSILDPTTGELVPVAEPDKVAALLARLREHKTLVFDVIRDCEAALIAESERQGTKTLRVGGHTAKITGGSALDWNLEVLEELLAAGLPEHRYSALVSIEQTYKVDAGVAKQIEASNPAYAAIIERARNRVPTKTRVSLA